MNKKAMREHLRRRKEEEEKKDRKFITKDKWFSIRNGENRFKLLNWTNPETDLFFRSVFLQWVPTGAKTATPFKYVEGSVLDRVYSAIKKSKDDSLRRIASRLKPQEHGLAFVIDSNDLQLKVLNTKIAGIDAISEFLLGNAEAEESVSKINNKTVLVVDKEVKQVTRNGNTFNQSFYKVSAEDDKNFTLLPKVKKEIKTDLPDIMNTYENYDESYALGLLDEALDKCDTSVAAILGDDSLSGTTKKTKSAKAVAVSEGGEDDEDEDEDEDLFEGTSSKSKDADDEEVEVSNKDVVAKKSVMSDDDLDDVEAFLRDDAE